MDGNHMDQCWEITETREERRSIKNPCCGQRAINILLCESVRQVVCDACARKQVFTLQSFVSGVSLKPEAILSFCGLCVLTVTNQALKCRKFKWYVNNVINANFWTFAFPECRITNPLCEFTNISGNSMVRCLRVRWGMSSLSFWQFASIQFVVLILTIFSISGLPELRRSIELF